MCIRELPTEAPSAGGTQGGESTLRGVVPLPWQRGWERRNSDTKGGTQRSGGSSEWWWQ